MVEHNFKEKLEFELFERNENSEVVIEEIIKNLDKKKSINMGSNNNDDNCINLEINYEVFLPVNAELSINSISGDIEVKSMTNTLILETISGFVDVSLDAMGKYNIVCSTITGEIYTDLKLDNNAQAKHDIVGSKLKTSLNGGGKSIKLKSISGDLFIRKRK